MMHNTFFASILVAACFLAGLAGTVWGNELRFKVKVQAGDVERIDSPTRIALAPGQEIEAAEIEALRAPVAAKLIGADQREVRAQVSRGVATDGGTPPLIVSFVLPSLEKGKTAEFDLVLSPGEAPAAPKEGFHYADGDGFRDLFYGDRGVLRHMIAYDPARREETYKPFHHVYGFHGEGMITKGAGGQYTHHRGIFIGWNKTSAGGKTYDFWHCPAEFQQHVMYLGESQVMGPVFARMVSTTDWQTKEGGSIIRDRRDVTTRHVGPGTTLMDWTISLSAVGDAVMLEGDPQHAGFQFRAAEEVQEGKAQYIRPSSAKDRGNDEWTDCPWAAAAFSVQGRPYVVAHFSSPQNPGPLVYSTRPYGRFGAFFTGEVRPNVPLVLNYRVVVLDPQTHKGLDAATLGARFEDYITPAQVSVERKK